MERDRFGDARRPEHGSNNGQRVEVEAPRGDRRQAAGIRRYGMMTCTGLMIASASALAVLFLKPYMPSTPFRFLFSLLAKGGLMSGLALATGSLVCLLAANLRSRLEMDVPETGCATGTGPGTRGATPGTVSDTRRKPLRPRRELLDLGGWLYNLADLGFLKWWYFVGTFILLAGVIGLVTWQWNAIGGYFVFFTVLAVTVGFYLLAYYLAERARIGSSIVFIIASALVPVSFYVFNHFKIAGRSFDPNVMGIACSLIAAAVYALNSYRSRNQVMFAFTMLTGLSLLFFILRASGTSVHFWGPWFAGAAALYFIAGYVMKRAGLDTCSKTMFAVGNAGIAMGLLTTIGDIEYFVGPGLKTLGILLMSSAAALLIGSYTYDDRVLAYVSSGLILASSFFMAREPGTAWYLTAPAITAAAGILLALGLADRLLVKEHDGGPFVYSGVAALLGIVGVMAGKDAIFNIPRLWRASGRPEVLGSLVTAAMAACLMWAAAIVQRKKALGYLAFAITVYASLVGLGYCVYDLPIYIARSFTHTVYTYMFAWALVFSCAALVLGRLDPDGGRFRFLSEPLAWAGLAYLASGTGVATWVATHRYAPVALALSVLGAMMAAAFLGTRGRIAEWMERPAWLGSILVGTAAVSCSLQSSSWSMYYGNVLSIAALTACIFIIGAARRQKAFFVTASCVYGTASLGSFIYYFVSNPTLTPATGGWQIVSLFSIAALAIGCSFYLDDVFAHAAGHVFAAIGLIALGCKLDLYPQHGLLAGRRRSPVLFHRLRERRHREARLRDGRVVDERGVAGGSDRAAHGCRSGHRGDRCHRRIDRDKRRERGRLSEGRPCVRAAGAVDGRDRLRPGDPPAVFLPDNRLRPGLSGSRNPLPRGRLAVQRKEPPALRHAAAGRRRVHCRRHYRATGRYAARAGGLARRGDLLHRGFDIRGDRDAQGVRLDGSPVVRQLLSRLRHGPRGPSREQPVCIPLLHADRFVHHLPGLLG